MFKMSIFWLYGNDCLVHIKPEELKKAILDYSKTINEGESKLDRCRLGYSNEP